MDLISLDTYPSTYKSVNIELNKSDKDLSIVKHEVVDWVTYEQLQDCFIKSGKCFFDAISLGLRKTELAHSAKKLRSLLYKYLINNEPEYKVMKGIKTKKQLANYIKTFDGDFETLEMLSKLLNVDFYIFENSILPKEIGGINNNILLLDLLPGILGLKNNGKKNPQTLFNRNNLPQILANIIDPKIYFENNIKQFFLLF